MEDKPKECSCFECKFKSTPVSLLDEEELKYLCNNCVHIDFKEGENIIRQGAFTTNIAYMTSGLAKVHMEGPLKKDEIIKITKAPAFIGAPSVFSDRVFHYSVTSLTDAKVCFIDYQIFDKLLLENGEFAKELIKELSSDLVKQFHSCVNKTQKRLNAYIAEVLLFFAESIFESNDFHLPLSRNEFAQLVGSTRETITRIFHDLAEMGILNIQKDRIKIINTEKLSDISRLG